MKKPGHLSFAKIKEKTSRMSLTIVLSIFVFAILLSAIALTSLGLWLLTLANVIVDVDGKLQLGSVILFMTVISLFLGGVIAFFGSRIPLKPVNNIINKMNRLAAGDFKTRLKYKSTLPSRSAVREFAESFNTMAEQLENTEMLRNDFINNFSHEFKTPIVSITGLANLLEVGDLTDEQRIQYAKAIREESMRLSTMASNVLQLTKVENQTILTDVSKFNLSEQIRSSVLLLEEKWTSKNIDLQLDFDEYTIEANEELLKQVWINLIDNAVKFVPINGTVILEIIDDGELFTVNISNTGSEIPEDKRERIFNKFYQVDESHATQGNGIGLAIVKRIVELHNGSITVKSENNLITFSVVLYKKNNL
ncbi:MAG: HAMP domain-containing histidine kinase [Ruminococcaceae bacterium]|nr:HAMP domain-containing histidine kinase [Oscillospiraceae bacterium]